MECGISVGKTDISIERSGIRIKLFSLITSAGIHSKARVDPRGNASIVVSPGLDQLPGSYCGHEPLRHMIIKCVPVTAQADLKDIRLPVPVPPSKPKFPFPCRSFAN